MICLELCQLVSGQASAQDFLWYGVPKADDREAIAGLLAEAGIAMVMLTFELREFPCAFQVGADDTKLSGLR